MVLGVWEMPSKNSILKKIVLTFITYFAWRRNKYLQAQLIKDIWDKDV
jgi:hypothetical protein